MPAYRTATKPKRHATGPHSRLLAKGIVSGRSTEGRYLRTIEHELAKHCGGSPTFLQKMLIRRLAVVSLRLELLDKKFSQGKPTDWDTKVYGALHNSFRLLAREIGIKSAVVERPGQALDEHLRRLGVTQ